MDIAHKPDGNYHSFSCIFFLSLFFSLFFFFFFFARRPPCTVFGEINKGSAGLGEEVLVTIRPPVPSHSLWSVGIFFYWLFVWFFSSPLTFCKTIKKKKKKNALFFPLLYPPQIFVFLPTRKHKKM